MKHDHPLRPIVERSFVDPSFLGYAIHQMAAGWDDAEIANHFGCTVERLPRLFLCRAIDPTEADFEQNIKTISEYVPCDADALRALLER